MLLGIGMGLLPLTKASRQVRILTKLLLVVVLAKQLLCGHRHLLTLCLYLGTVRNVR